MFVKFELDSTNPHDLLVLDHLFTTLKIDVVPQKTDGVSPSPAETPEPKKRGRGKAKAKTEGPTDAEIKEFDMDQMISHLQHKDDDPTVFEVKWSAKLFKKKHGQQDDIKAILHDFGSNNFIDLKKKDYKKFTTLLAEKDASLTTENSGDDLDI